MKKIPYRSICIGCGILALLVAGRCGATAGRVIYYHLGSVWKTIFADPWTYIGIVSAAVSAGAGAIMWWEKKQARKSEQEESQEQ